MCRTQQLYYFRSAHRNGFVLFLHRLRRIAEMKFEFLRLRNSEFPDGAAPSEIWKFINEKNSRLVYVSSSVGDEVDRRKWEHRSEIENTSDQTPFRWILFTRLEQGEAEQSWNATRSASDPSGMDLILEHAERVRLLLTRLFLLLA